MTTRSAQHRMVLAPLLGATFLGTVANNIVNVPLSDITASLNVSVSSGVVAVSAFALTLAVTMPAMGWAGDRIGRRRMLVLAQLLLAGSLLGAALAGSLTVLVAFRVGQGLACAAVPPAVMGMLSTRFGAAKRGRVMGMWAAANGIGQAAGPPLGGLVAGLLGWRAIFWLLIPLVLLTVAATLRLVASESSRRVPLHRTGAAVFTVGAALLMTSVAAAQGFLPAWLRSAFAGAGVVMLVAFFAVSRKVADPLVPPRLVMESRFLRSSAAVTAMMFGLGAVLVATPLYVTNTLALPTGVAGLVVFALPAAMAGAAPIAGLLTERTRPRWILRAGLLTLTLAELGLAWFCAASDRQVAILLGILAVLGVSIGLVQTPAAAGATSSAAGQHGATLGLFNTLRFGGSTLGIAWVGLFYQYDVTLLFMGCAVVAILGLLASFAGADPVIAEPAPPAGALNESATSA